MCNGVSAFMSAELPKRQDPAREQGEILLELLRVRQRVHYGFVDDYLVQAIGCQLDEMANEWRRDHEMPPLVVKPEDAPQDTRSDGGEHI